VIGQRVPTSPARQSSTPSVHSSKIRSPVEKLLRRAPDRANFQPMKRIPSIDIARGLVMVIMALDHTRELLGVASIAQNPTDLATTTPILFLTRWITHLCAPTFVFLSGTSAALSLAASKDIPATRRFLLRRGIILVLVEFTLVIFGLSFDPHFRLLLFEVIATIGTGFILLSFLSRLPLKVLAVLAFLLFFGHDLLPPPLMAAPSSAGSTGIDMTRFIKSLLWSPGAFPLTPRLLFVVAYPILSWLGIMLTGFVAGRWFQKPAEQRKKLFRRLGLFSLGLFLLLRWFNLYGEPDHWSPQKNTIFTILSFLNVSKYPPSLLFSLVTLGVLFLILSAAEGKDSKATRVLLVYGRTPLFYFIVHIYLIHLLVFVIAFLQGFHPQDLQFGPFQFGRPATGFGLPLAGIYAVWLAVVVALYPLCRWYGRYKAAHPEKAWLRYF
jgi:uncharacterized membrane protein